MGSVDSTDAAPFFHLNWCPFNDFFDIAFNIETTFKTQVLLFDKMSAHMYGEFYQNECYLG